MHKIKYVPWGGFMIYDKDGKQIDLPLREVIINDNWSENQKRRSAHYQSWSDYYQKKGHDPSDAWNIAQKEHPFFETVKVTFELECIFEQ